MIRTLVGDLLDNGKAVKGGACVLEPGNWLTANRPLKGDPSLLLEQQSALWSLVKVGSGPCLRTELPFSREGKNHDRLILEEMIFEASETIQGRKAVTTHSPPSTNRIQHVLREFRDSWSRDISDSDTGLVLNVRAGQSEQEVRIEPSQKGVRLWIELFRLGEPDPVWRDVMNHFCVDLNSRLRMARVSRLLDIVVLEVMLEERVLNPWRMDKAIGALLVGTQYAKREGAVLRNLEVAQSYCAFHQLLTFSER